VAGRNAELEPWPPDQFLLRAKYFLDWEEEMARYALEFIGSRWRFSLMGKEKTKTVHPKKGLLEVFPVSD